MDVAKASPRCPVCSLWSKDFCTTTKRQRCYLIPHSFLSSSSTLHFHLYYPTRYRIDLPKQIKKILGCKAELADSSSLAPPLPPVAKIEEERKPGHGPIRSKKKKRKSIIKSRTGDLRLSGKSVIQKVPYLTGIGLDLDQIKDMVRRQPAFAYLGLEGKIKPTVEFLLDLGVDHSDIPFILYRSPSLCGFRIQENLVPKMEFLESLCIDKQQWAKVIRRYPPLLTHSIESMRNTAEHLSELGMSKEDIGSIFTRLPGIIRFSIDAKLRPTEEYLHSLGIDVAALMYKHPQTFELSLAENLIPKVELLENLGLDKERWPKMMQRCPALLGYSNKNIEATVNYLSNLGISNDDIGKMFGKCPGIIVLNVEKKIRPIQEYFHSLRVDAVPLMRVYPSMFVLNLERCIKPKTQFFLDMGFTIEEIRAMVSMQPSLYGLSIEKNLVPKWEFFQAMNCPRTVFVTYPSLLTVSLRGRIKPRYGLVKKCGVQLLLYEWLIPSNSNFLKKLERRMTDS